VFLESYRADLLVQVIGHRLQVAQVNYSVSRRGTIRGVHFADVPPGQAKYVTCSLGAVLDVVVDVRQGSPTFGAWDAVRLDDRDREAVYVAEGLGHAFMTLTEEATVTYLCSELYAPDREHGVNPLDPALGIGWPSEIEPVLSPRDKEAPSLADVRAQGLLPAYDECLALYAEHQRTPDLS
jgi:dTDP-4-dehydrorhamnose 3,5-epimerase